MSIERHKSLKLNMVLNAIRSLLGVIFPIITFPYVSRVLGVENIGRYNYSSSIISYFLLLSELGITKYAIREGSAVREDKESLNQFSSEMFTINVLTATFSYILFVLWFFLFPGIREYGVLLGILSFQIALKTVGVEWVYSIFEDYLYITVRTIAFQILSLVLLFCLVHSREDLNIYAVITVVAGAGSNIINFLHSRKKVRIRLTRTIDWKRHMRPILVLFATTLTVSIYLNSDVTILGILCGDRTVGIYSVSVKVYSTVKNILASVLAVSIPRLSAQVGTSRMEEFRNTANDIYRTLITWVLPTVTGIILLAKPIVLLVSGSEYIEAASSLSILAAALLLCMPASFWGNCVLLPMHRENTLFKVSLVSAALNVVLNFILIPACRENAAAFTTLLAEGCTLLGSMIQGRKISGIQGESRTYFKAALGCAAIIAVHFFTKRMFTGSLIYVCMTVILSITAYALSEILLKNEVVIDLFNKVRKIASRRASQ